MILTGGSVPTIARAEEEVRVALDAYRKHAPAAAEPERRRLYRDWQLSIAQLAQAMNFARRSR